MADMSTQAAARFRDTQLIGRGVFGDVYSALDEVLQRNVAVKIFRELDPRQHQRIFDALRRSSELRHPNIVQVYDTISQDDALHVVLTLCENGSLADLVQKSRLDQQDVCRLFSGLADGVSYMHAHGIAHCDLKLANVLLDDSQQPVLIDLDNCRDLTDSTSWEFQGTPSYMAPELINQACAPSIQSEVYAMGIMLYEMLQGELLADSWPIHEAINRTGFAVSAFDHSQFASGRDWRAILEKATHEEPGRRYASIAEMAADVASVAEGKAISARPIGRLERMTRTAKQQPLTSALILVTFLSVSIGVAAANVARYQAAGNQRRLERNNANLTEKIDELRQSELRLQEVISEVKNELVVAERAESNQRRLTAEAEAATAKLQEAAERSIELTEQAQAALNQARESEASVKQLEERRSALGELLNTTAFESESMEYFAAIQKTQQLIQQEDWQAASLSLGSTNSEFRGIEFDILSASIRSKQVHPKIIELCEVSPRIWKRRVLASRPGFGKTQPFGKGASFRAFVPAKRTYGSARRIVQSYAELQSSLVDNPSLIFDDKFFGRSYSVEKLRYKPMLMLDDGSLVVYESSSSHGGFASVLTFRDEHYERLFEGKSKLERLELIEGLVGVERQTEGGDPDQIVNQPQATQDRLAGNGDAVEKPVKRDSMDARTDSDPATQPTENPAQSFLQWVLNTGGDVKQSNGSQLAVEDVPESPLDIQEIVLRNVTDPDQQFRGSPPNLGIERVVLENCPLPQVSNILLANKESLTHIEMKGKIDRLAIDQLAEMPQLKELRLTACWGIPPQAWRELRLPQNIRYVSLNATKAEEFRFLQQIPNVEGLTLWACGISDQDLVHLRNLPKLKRIQLGSNQEVTDRGMSHVASVEQLAFLSVYDTAVGDIGMKEIGRLKELTKLSLGRTQVSDVGLKSLGHLTKLEWLELTATEVTADGINALEFPRLERLHIEECDIDATAIGRFLDTHPSCKVTPST